MNSKQIKILCYGDSNTWGYVPLSGERYPSDVRWAGVLQNELGQDFLIIEDGLNGRSTDVDDPRPERPGKNGRTSLIPSIQNNNPLDIVILMLGTNDLKKIFNRTTDQIAEAVEGLVDAIKDNAIPDVLEKTVVLLISPPLVDEAGKEISERYAGASVTSKELAKKYEKVAQENNCEFLDAALYTNVGEDGVHLDANSHKVLGKAIAEKISAVKKEIYG